MKYVSGPITTADRTKSMDIIVQKTVCNSPLDILIGGVLIIAGVMYLTNTAYKGGAMHFEREEFEVMKKLGIIHV